MGYRPSRDRAKDFLVENLLGRGPVERQAILEAAEAAGIPVRTIQRCNSDLGTVYLRRGSIWQLDSLPEPITPKEILSLGAGVQSTTLALLACEGELHLDAAIFADTGWEPAAVYAHLDRLEAHMAKFGIPVYRVGSGNIRSNCLDPSKRFVSVPYYTVSPSGKRGIGRRQCTNEYKIRPIGRKVRELLGASPPNYRVVPPGARVNQWIGFSTDEIGRVNDKHTNWYTTNRYPLLELGMSRTDCIEWLKSRGWNSVAKSACIGCPYHSNDEWLSMKRNRPSEWADAVEFDKAIRKGGARGKPLDGEAFLHPTCVPLDEVKFTDNWGGDPDGCSPYGCRSGSIAGS